MQEQHCSQESHSQGTQTRAFSSPHLKSTRLTCRISAFCAFGPWFSSSRSSCRMLHGCAEAAAQPGVSSATSHPAEAGKCHLCLPGKTLFSPLFLNLHLNLKLEKALHFFSMMIYFSLFGDTYNWSFLRLFKFLDSVVPCNNESFRLIVHQGTESFGHLWAFWSF